MLSHVFSKKRAEAEASARTKDAKASTNSERITQSKLHNTAGTRFADWRLRTGVTAKIRRRSSVLERILIQAEVRNRAEALRIGYVENFSAELKSVVLRIRHLKALAQSDIQRKVAGDTKQVALSYFTGHRVAERAVRLRRVRKDVWSPIHVAL